MPDWRTEDGPDGFTYHIKPQDKRCSCASACIMMVARLAKEKILDEYTVRGWCRDVEVTGKRQNWQDFKYGSRNWDRGGTDPDTVVTVLSEKLGFKGAYTYRGRTKAVKFPASTSRKKPAIVGVDRLQ